MENRNPTISPNVNIETTVPAVTVNTNNSKNKIVSENESENEITVDIHVHNSLPTNVNDVTFPIYLANTRNIKETDTFIPA